MNVTDYVLRILDQEDEDDQFIGATDVADAATKSVIKDRAVLEKYANADEYLAVGDTGLYVTMTMQDLFDGAADTSLERKTYYFQPRYYILEAGRSVLVNDAVADPATYAYDELQAQVTFDSQQAAGAVVKVTGLMVSFTALMEDVLNTMVSMVETTPDIFGSRNAELAARLRRFRAREWRVTL